MKILETFHTLLFGRIIFGKGVMIASQRKEYNYILIKGKKEIEIKL